PQPVGSGPAQRLGKERHCPTLSARTSGRRRPALRPPVRPFEPEAVARIETGEVGGLETHGKGGILAKAVLEHRVHAWVRAPPLELARELHASRAFVCRPGLPRAPRMRRSGACLGHPYPGLPSARAPRVER